MSTIVSQKFNAITLLIIENNMLQNINVSNIINRFSENNKKNKVF